MGNWLSDSEIFTGLVTEERQSASVASADDLHPPYNNVIRFIQKAGSVVMDDLIEEFGVEVIQPALSAAHSVNGLGERINWGRQLKNGANGNMLANEFDRGYKNLKAGRPVDYNRIKNAIQAYEGGDAIGLKPLSEVKNDPVMLVPSGYAPVDKMLGGIPKQGIIFLAGEPGTGKTFLQSRLTATWAYAHKKDEAAIFTLEMQDGEIRERLLLCEPRLKDSDVAKRILINDKWVSIDDICREVASRPAIKFVVIDFINLLVRGMVSDEAMGAIYVELMRLTKEQHVTVLAIGQLKQNFAGGIPHPADAYYGGMAMRLGWSVWTIFSPSATFTRYNKKNITELPYVSEDNVYLFSWKQRGKYPNKYPGPSAIVIEKDPNFIWGDKASYVKVQGDI